MCPVCSLLTTICGTTLDKAWRLANVTASRLLAITAVLVVVGATAGIALLAQKGVPEQVSSGRLRLYSMSIHVYV